MEGCTNLEVLVLSKNQLRGEIPECLGTMENLYVLDLQENRLSGEIPESLANLSSSIEFLFLYSNMLTGAIPPALGNLSGLLHLDLMDNMLSGAIPWSLLFRHAVQPLLARLGQQQPQRRGPSLRLSGTSPLYGASTSN
jgi:Leucine-rich repeat (LRR) protein